MNQISILLKSFKVFTITLSHIRKANHSIEHTAIKKSWAVEMLAHFNMDITRTNNLQLPEGPVIFVGNHISYLDIPLLFSCYPETSFVSKKEIQSWPVFGKAAIKAKTLFVNRSSPASRQLIKNEMTNTLIANQLKLVIFPSGTTNLGLSHQWKKGAFEIAALNNIPIVPFKIRYEPLRNIAFVGNDNFVFHLFGLLKHKKLRALIEFHPPVQITDPLKDSAHWKNWSENF